MPGITRLTGQQYREFTRALMNAFPGPAPLNRMVVFWLSDTLGGRNLAAITLADSLEGLAFDLIGAAQAEGWLDDLIRAAREANPRSPDLLKFSEQFGLASSGPQLERIIRQAIPLLDVTVWRTRLGELEPRVCRIEIPLPQQTIYGTGFLVGPSTVLTNHHVVEDVIKGRVKPSEVKLRFDYKRLVDQVEISQGTTFSLASEWLIDSSPMSPVDTQADPKSGDPGEEQLDYALLQVEGEPGEGPVGRSAAPNALGRGWIELPGAVDFSKSSSFFILQHPEGFPLKLAFDMQSNLRLNGNDTRVRYETNTMQGSSGSPCFDHDWNLLALHHSGNRGLVPQYNEGIPIHRVRGLIEKRGFGGLLGGPPPAPIPA